MIINKALKDNVLNADNELLSLLTQSLLKSDDVLCIGVAGEIECKTQNLSSALAEKLENDKSKTIILNVDDYFYLPPIKNSIKRSEDINNVGPKEVNFNQLIGNIEFLKGKESDILFKPKVNIDTDTIRKEFIEVDQIQYVIVHGRYSLLLDQVDVGIYMTPPNNHLSAAKSDIDKRARMIEHEIIRKHKRLANYVCHSDGSFQTNTPSEELGRHMWQ